MYARVAIATGWTWEYIGQCLTLPRLNAMYEYWKMFPPLHESVAGALGIRPDSTVLASEDVAPSLDNATLTREMHADPRFLVWRTKAANG